MIRRDGPPAYGALIQFPSDTQNAARQLDLDMAATDRAVDAGTVDSGALENWRSFYAGWKLYFKPIDDSWTFNPLGSAAFADQADIEDWRKRLKVQQSALAAHGADQSSLPVSPDRVGNNPLSWLTDSLSQVKWIAVAGLAIYLAVTYLPKSTRKGK